MNSLFNKSTNGTSSSTGGATITSNVNFSITKDTTISGNCIVTGTTPSTSTTTGALKCSGGAGIGGSVYVGGSIYTNNVAIGTYLTNSNSVASPVSGTPYAPCSLSLSQGVWIVNFNMDIAGGPSSYNLVSISPNATPDSQCCLVLGAASPNYNPKSCITRLITLGSTATWYGVFQYGTTSGMTTNCYMTAVKIA